MPSYTAQYHSFKRHELYKDLGSAYSQQILRKQNKSWKSFFGSLKSDKVEHGVSLPGSLRIMIPSRQFLSCWYAETTAIV
ncbi:MAG: hypothetical protein ACOC44_01430 [Promethearchaeia archaeon]